jgi:dTDP-4-amino-4,6-dideoxygalactose transaminase
MTINEHRRDISIADPEIATEEKERVLSVMEDGYLADGDQVRGFEDAFADYCDTDYGVAAANGTAALHTALDAVGIGEGDCVVTTPFSFVATANTVRHCGAEPIFADIDPETYNLDPEAVRTTIEARGGDVDAILVVHLYGLPADLEAFQALADEYDATLVEDCAQAHGGTVDGQPVGSFGDAAAFSFYPTKNMTTGEGGMVVTDDEAIAERAASFVNHGRAPNDASHYERVGYNYRMTNVAAAIGLAQLERLPEFTAARRVNGRVLSHRLSDVDIVTPTVPPDRQHVFHQYTVRCRDRETVQDRLDEFGIDTGVYYPTPIHELPPYDDVDVNLPVAERVAEEVLSLPVHPNLSAQDLRTIATAVEYVINDE